jgi:hypothetical protein
MNSVRPKYEAGMPATLLLTLVTTVIVAVGTLDSDVKLQ